MYAYEWDSSTGGYILTPMPLAFSKEPRPVYYKELDILGFDKYWDYDKNDSFPYMWAEANNYYYRGRLVAKTKGGSLYTPPELVLIEDPEPEGYPLRFVDIPAMVDKNRQLMEQLVQETIKKIYNTFIEYKDKVDVFYVAFSGGKDSVVTLDLVQRALPHNEFKVLFGDTGMEFPDTYEDYEFDCDSEITRDGFTIHCSGNKSHGTEDLRKSFAKSCNSSFANIGLTIDNNKLNALCNDMLFNKDIPIEFESKASKFSLSNSDTTALTMQTCIGQGNTLVSPLHMCMVAGAICNGGTLMTPYIVDRVENAGGMVVTQNEPQKNKALMSEKQAAFLQDLMSAVVSEGTGSKLADQSYDAYGKTGTAQVSDTTDQTNAWFVGYAKKDGYNDLAIAVVVEDSGAGSTYAVPIAKKVFDTYFNE